MHVLTCPDCSAVMHQVEEVTARAMKIGADHLSAHMIEVHVMPRMNAMLEFTAELAKVHSIEYLKEALTPSCPGCGLAHPKDSFNYVCFDGRTQLCCSVHCREKVVAEQR